MSQNITAVSFHFFTSVTGFTGNFKCLLEKLLTGKTPQIGAWPRGSAKISALKNTSNTQNHSSTWGGSGGGGGTGGGV